MDMEWVKAVVNLVEESEIDSLDLELVASEPGEPRRIRVRKSPPQGTMAGALPAVAPSVAVAAPQAGGAAEPPPASGGESADGLADVTSPMVGTFYRAASPDSDPFVSVGDHVSPGHVLCILEAMKLMNELTSEISGVVREVLVENAQPVEFGETLFRIEPEAGAG